MRLKRKNKCPLFLSIWAFLLLGGNELFAQEDCRDFIKLDSLQAIEIAKEEDFYKDQHVYYTPKIQLERLEGHCVWNIESKDTQHSTKGHCAKTNGCTILTQYNIYISVEEGLIVEKHKKERYYPNYE